MRSDKSEFDSNRDCPECQNKIQWKFITRVIEFIDMAAGAKRTEKPENTAFPPDCRSYYAGYNKVEFLIKLRKGNNAPACFFPHCLTECNKIILRLFFLLFPITWRSFHKEYLQGEEKDDYNAVVSSEDLSNSDFNYLSCIKTTEYKEAAESMLDSLILIIIALLGSAAIIFVMVIYLMLKFMMDKAKNNISLLFPYLTAGYSVYLNPIISVSGYLELVGFMFLTYSFVYFYLKKKLKRIEFAEVLKDRE